MKKKVDLFEISRTVAKYYGFNSIADINSALVAESNGRREIKKLKDDLQTSDRVALLKAYIDSNLSSLPQPLLIYHLESPGKEFDQKQFGGKGVMFFSLEVIGTTKSIGEAILFRTVEAIFRETGFGEYVIEINSLGDRDSIARFTREFNTYYKKRVEEVPSHCRSNLKKDVFKVLSCAQDKCMLAKENAPKPIELLSESNRSHFGEVVEYLEGMGIPYGINNCLVGGRDFYTKTLFEFRAVKEDNSLLPDRKVLPLLAKGGRYDDLSKKFGCKKEIPAVGVTLTFGGLGVSPSKIKNQGEKQPKIYLIHLGFEAKLKSLSALEILRKSRFPIVHGLSKDRISAQITIAERMNIPFTIIIGQKEALEGSAIVRNMANRSQETVLLENLPTYLRKVRVL